MKVYASRPIRFIEILAVNDWKVKVYSISDQGEYVGNEYVEKAKGNLANWFNQSNLTDLESYKIATLILHEWDEGCFAVVNWWIDENMLQHFVYLTPSVEKEYELFSNNGIVTCVWELSILWFERNAWVKHVLSNETPDFESYLETQLNQD